MSKKESPETTLFSMETLVLRWFMVSDFWLGIPIQKSKTLFPLSPKSTFLKVYKKKTKSTETSFVGIGRNIVQFKVFEARKRARNENCHHDSIKWNNKPKFYFIWFDVIIYPGLQKTKGMLRLW